MITQKFFQNLTEPQKDEIIQALIDYFGLYIEEYSGYGDTEIKPRGELDPKPWDNDIREALP